MAFGQAIEQLQGAVVSASSLEQLVLPARVLDYEPGMLDRLTSAGEVLWAGHGRLPSGDGWIALYHSETAPLYLPEPAADAVATPLHEAVLDALSGGAAMFFRDLSDRVGSLDDIKLSDAIWDLVWGGWLSNDTLAPLRALLRGGQSRFRVPPTEYPRYVRGARVPRRPWMSRPMPSRTGPPICAGRWSRLPPIEGDPTVRAHALAGALLDRYGVLTRGSVVSERVPGGFAAIYPVLKAMEEQGTIRRGYFVAGLGGAQFAVPGAVDRLRAWQQARAVTPTAPGWQPPVPGGWRERTPPSPDALVLAATDPANPYGAALPWPGRDDAGGHRPGRKAGAIVVLVDGELVLYVERGGKSLLSFTDDMKVLGPAVDALALAVREGSLGRLAVERADGGGILDSPLAEALAAAGFRPTPRGLRLRK
jgi:ATP-dependent Lhr-like helicase